jgi:thiol-disulfide isomerase/thioredoxin
VHTIAWRTAAIVSAAFSLTVMTAQVPSILIANVQYAIAQGNVDAAAAEVAQFRSMRGNTPEALEALSWVARGELAAGRLDQADKTANEVRELTIGSLHGNPLDADPHLAMALGASFEVSALVLDARHEKAEALQLLETALRTWHATSIATRLRKNINLMTMIGKPLPPLQETQWIVAKPPAPASLHGKVLLLFFWAHWCPDCKADAPILARIANEFEKRGLVIIAPTRLYGYTPTSDPADPGAEKAFILRTFDQFYSSIPNLSVPFSAANFDRFGVSTTPTFVIVDPHGIVRLYHPGTLDEAQLRAAIEPLLPASGK